MDVLSQMGYVSMGRCSMHERKPAKAVGADGQRGKRGPLCVVWWSVERCLCAAVARCRSMLSKHVVVEYLVVHYSSVLKEYVLVRCSSTFW